MPTHRKPRANNLKEFGKIIAFLQEHGITDVETLESYISKKRSIPTNKQFKEDYAYSNHYEYFWKYYPW